MSELTEKVQNCGLCGCGNCKSITYKDAQEAINVVKSACIEAVEKETLDRSCACWIGVIKAIREVK